MLNCRGSNSPNITASGLSKERTTSLYTQINRCDQSDDIDPIDYIENEALTTLITVN